MAAGDGDAIGVWRVFLRSESMDARKVQLQ